MSKLPPEHEQMFVLAMASMDLRADLAVLDKLYNDNPTMVLGQLGNLEDCLSRLTYVVERLRERRAEHSGSAEPTQMATVTKLTPS